MIFIIVTILSFLKTIIQTGLNVASFIGEVIVASLSGISSTLTKATEAIITFIKIVHDDNILIFTEEIPNFMNNVIATFVNQYNYIVSDILSVYSNLIYNLLNIIFSIKALIDGFISILWGILLHVKYAVVLIGNTVWLLITFMPIHLLQILQEGFQYLSLIAYQLIVEAYMVLLSCTNFMTDVPLESFMGITSAIVIVRLYMHFRDILQEKVIKIYWFLKRKTLYLYYTLYNYLMDSEIRVITHMGSTQDITSREANFSMEFDNGANADVLCIICQERQKCVLTLPCRHVCLCAECCRRLYGYQRTCPICRTFIYHSVTVYL